MSDSLFKKLPDIWKDLDLRVSDVVLNTVCFSCGYTIEEDYFGNKCPRCHKFIEGRGLLERFLAIPDAGVARLEGFISELLRAHNIQEIRDRFLPLLSTLVGHNWQNDKPRQWNRNRTQLSITRHSYKGTIQRLQDTTKECGSTICEVQDNASRLMIVGKQGRIGMTDCVIMDHNYWHDGSYELTVDSYTDWDELALGMLETNAAGQIWWVKSAHQIDAPFEIDVSPGRTTRIELENLSEIAIGRGIIGQSFWVGFERLGNIQRKSILNTTHVAGGYLTVDSNIRVDHSEIDVDEGTAANPLTEIHATYQDSPEITEI